MYFVISIIKTFNINVVNYIVGNHKNSKISKCLINFKNCFVHIIDNNNVNELLFLISNIEILNDYK